MKHILLWATLMVVAVCACYDTTEGYLITDNASYDPDTMYIRKSPVWILDSVRMMENSPWVTLALQGYEGTEPIYFSIESVTSSEGEEVAGVFREELSIRGGGTMMYPLQNNAKPGSYTVSIRLSNAGYSQVVENAFTFVVVE